MIWNAAVAFAALALTMPSAAACGEAAVKRVAALTTVFTPNSHAEVIIGRCLPGYIADASESRPGLEVASLYVDQTPEDDLSRELAVKYNFALAPSVEAALTLGTGSLAVDGVLLVAEHGEYPVSSTGQVIYPKRRLFEQVLKVFDASGRVVPVFVDKHLADNWTDAKWLYDSARERGIPLLAGSSLPLLWRFPPIDIPRGERIDQILAVSYHSLDAYGFHALELVQALVEGRAGGETGIRSVQCLEDEAVWRAGDEGVYDPALLDAALARIVWRPVPGEIRDVVPHPVFWIIDYADGLKARVLTLNPAIGQWAVAWRMNGDEPNTNAAVRSTVQPTVNSTVQSTLCWTHEERPYMHFASLVAGIDHMMQSNQPPWPVERTLLTSGTLDLLLNSRQQGGVRLETPQLELQYESKWKWQQPTILPEDRTYFPDRP